MGIRTETRRHSSSQPWTYALLNERQRQILTELTESESAPGALLLSEVAPVITVGRRTPASDLLVSPELLAHQGIDLVSVDRGGLATYHGPGQWVLFAVDRLERLTGDPRGVRRAVEGLLEIALEVGRQYDPTAEIRGGAEAGVWGARGKFAAVGVHIEKGVLLHGLSINGFQTPQSFQGLRPCGLPPRIQFLLPEPSEEDFVSLGKRLESAAFGRFWRSEGLENGRLTGLGNDAIHGDLRQIPSL